ALRGTSAWKALEAGAWAAGGWDPRLFEACLCRSQTLAQPPTFSHRFPTTKQMREWVKSPVAYRIEYTDGLKATMLPMQGLVGDARLERPGRRFHILRPHQRRSRAAFDALLFAAEPKRDLLGSPDGQGRRDICDRKSAVPRRANAADNWPGRRSHGVPGHRPK